MAPIFDAATQYPLPQGYWTTRVRRQPCGHLAASLYLAAFCTQCGETIEDVETFVERVGYEEPVEFQHHGWWHLSSEHRLKVEDRLHQLADFFQLISADEMRPGVADEGVPF